MSRPATGATDGLVCWNCGAGLDEVPLPISRHATCAQCFNELHCCRLCQHFDPDRTTECFEDRADPPVQKENANFCEFFSPRAGAFQPASGGRVSAARNKLESLFDAPEAEREAPATDDQTSPGEETKADAARKKLDDLFG